MSEVTIMLRAEFNDPAIRDKIYELFVDFDTLSEKSDGYQKRKQILNKYGINDFSLFSDKPIETPDNIKHMMETLKLSSDVYFPDWQVTKIEYKGKNHLDMYLSSGPSAAFPILSKVGLIIDKADGQGVYFIGHDDQTFTSFFGYVKEKGKLKMCYDSNTDSKYATVLNLNYSDAMDILQKENAFFPFINWLVPSLYYLLVFPLKIIFVFVTWPIKKLFSFRNGQKPE